MATGDLDIQLMRRALRLAVNGRGHVEPNPLVGCVLAKEGRIIGEGYHAKYGGPHAEPTALAAITESANGATAYVTLEPCCHTNKKTPPCVPALIAAGIRRVLIGCVDPNPHINGKGAELLRAAGIDVTVNVLEDQAKQLLAPFIARTVYQRPYVTLKWAETADGKVAGAGGKRLQISNPRAMRVIHELRANCDAILVGSNTVLADDPMLSVRNVTPSRTLTRHVIDRQLRIPLTSRLVSSAREIPLTVWCEPMALSHLNDRIGALQERGVHIGISHFLEDMLTTLSVSNGVTHLLVEPGPTLARAFFEEGHVDRVWQIRSPARVDDPTAPAAAGIPGDYVRTGQLDIAGDTLAEYLNPASPVFFAAEPSADFVLAQER